LERNSKPEKHKKFSKKSYFTNFSADFKPIGPFQIRIKSDVLLSSQMQQTKNDALKVTMKFINMGKHVPMLMSGLEDVKKQMDSETPQAPTSRLQTNFKLFHVHMKAETAGAAAPANTGAAPANTGAAPANTGAAPATTTSGKAWKVRIYVFQTIKNNFRRPQRRCKPMHKSCSTMPRTLPKTWKLS
jgi:hypothetical protein